MRLPLATDIESRDGTLSKDAKLVNAIVDTREHAAYVMKRPGLAKSIIPPYGPALGSISWEGNIYHATGNAISQTRYEDVPLIGAPQPPSATAQMMNDGSDFVPFLTLHYGGGFLWNTYGDSGYYIETRKSNDGGATWSAPTGYNDTDEITQPFVAIRVSGNIYLISTGKVVRSSNGGDSWGEISAGNIAYGNSTTPLVVHDGARFISIKNTGANKGVYTSTDAIIWSLFAPLPAIGAFGGLPIETVVFHGGSVWAIDQYGNSLSKTTDLSNWTHYTVGNNSGYRGPSLASDGTSLISIQKDDASRLCVRFIDTFDPTSPETLYDFPPSVHYLASHAGSVTSDGTDFYAAINDVSLGLVVYKITVDPGSGSTISPGYTYAYTTTTPGLPLSWIGTSPGTAHLDKRLFIKNTEKAWVLTLAEPGTLIEVTDPDYPDVTVPGAAYLDGFFFVMTEGGEIRNSNLENPEAWNALDYITAEAEWDKGVAIAKHQNYIVALKDWTTELFHNAANPVASPLSRVSSAAIQIGCSQGYSVVQANGGLVFMSKTREKGRSVHFFPPNSFDPVEVASPAIQRVLSSADVTSVSAWGGKYAGKPMYVLNLITEGITLAYDFSSKVWTQWMTGESGHFQYGYYATDGRREFLMHETTGEVCEITPDIYIDDETPIKTVIRSKRFDGGADDIKTMSRLSVVGDEDDTNVSISWSNDDYKTWSAAKTINIGKRPAEIRRLGSFVSRSITLEHSDNSPLRLLSLDIGAK